MERKNISSSIYRGAMRTKEELINFMMQIGRLGQLQGKSTDWRELEDNIIAENDPAAWMSDEEHELQRLIEEHIEK